MRQFTHGRAQANTKTKSLFHAHLLTHIRMQSSDLRKKTLGLRRQTSELKVHSTLIDMQRKVIRAKLLGDHDQVKAELARMEAEVCVGISVCAEACACRSGSFGGQVFDLAEFRPP